MGECEFLLRKCDEAGSGERGVTALEKGMVLVSTTTAIAGGSKRRIPPHEVVDGVVSTAAEAQQGCRGKRTCTSSPASSSTGDISPAGSVVEHGALASSPRAAAAVNEKHLQGVAAVSAEDEEDAERLGFFVASGEKHSRKFDSSSSSSSSSQVEQVPVELVKMESTAAATYKEAGSRSSSPASRRKPCRGMAPPDDEIEAFFSKIEGSLRREFADKYNYDVVKDSPLEGRYEWVRIKP